MAVRSTSRTGWCPCTSARSPSTRRVRCRRMASGDASRPRSTSSTTDAVAVSRTRRDQPTVAEGADDHHECEGRQLQREGEGRGDARATRDEENGQTAVRPPIPRRGARSAGAVRGAKRTDRRQLDGPVAKRGDRRAPSRGGGRRRCDPRKNMQHDPVRRDRKDRPRGEALRWRCATIRARNRSS